jgi:DNA-binding transcriptional regulator YiaG
MDNGKEENGALPAIASRLRQAMKAIEKKRVERVEQVKAKTGRADLPLEQRKLTQQEAAAYCGVSTATIHRWTEEGLKTVPYGQRKRYLVKDLQDYAKKKK